MSIYLDGVIKKLSLKPETTYQGFIKLHLLFYLQGKLLGYSFDGLRFSLIVKFNSRIDYVLFMTTSLSENIEEVSTDKINFFEINISAIARDPHGV